MRLRKKDSMCTCVGHDVGRIDDRFLFSSRNCQEVHGRQSLLRVFESGWKSSSSSMANGADDEWGTMRRKMQGKPGNLIIRYHFRVIDNKTRNLIETLRVFSEY